MACSGWPETVQVRHRMIEDDLNRERPQETHGSALRVSATATKYQNTACDAPHAAVRMRSVLPRFSAIVPSAMYTKSATTFAVSHACEPGYWRMEIANPIAAARSSVSTTCGVTRTQRARSRGESTIIHTPRTQNSV